MRLWVLDSIHHAEFNKTAIFTSLHTQKYTLKYTPDCTRKHTSSLHDYMFPTQLSRRFQVHWVYSQVLFQACSQGRSHLHLMAHCQPAWLYTSKPAVKKLSSTLPSTLSSTLPIALANTLPAYLTISCQVRSPDAPLHTRECSQVHSRACSQEHSHLHSMAHSQPAWMYTPKPVLKKLSITFPSVHSSTLPIALDVTLAAYLALRSQVHSQEGRHSQSHLAICSHVPSCMLDPETWGVAEARQREAWGRWGMVGSVWRAAWGMWCVADGGLGIVAESWHWSIS